MAISGAETVHGLDEPTSTHARPETLAARQMTAIIERDEPDGVWRCHYCRVALVPPSGQTAALMPYPVRDHVVPRSRGGSDELSNLVVSCAHCNSVKGSRLLVELPPDWFRWRTGEDVEARRRAVERQRISSDNSVLRRARVILAERGMTLDEWVDPNGVTQ